MFPIPDALAAFYLVCFAVGVIFVVASLFMGLTQDATHLPGVDHGATGVDVGADGGHVGDAQQVGAGVDGHGPADGASGSADGRGHGHAGQHVSPINVSTVMAFLAWFGGAGYILRVYAGVLGFLSLLAATVAGLIGGALVFYFIARVLLPGQRFLDPADYRLEGTVARVTVPVGADRIGEIVYSKGGSRRSEGARSADGTPIERGTEVVIVRYERGIAYVEPWSSFVARG